MAISTNLKQLYEIDDHLWLLETIKLLKQKNFYELDSENLIAELESLARKDKNAVASLLEQVIRHLLLLQYWTEELELNSAHWQAELYGFRTQLKRKLTTNLQNYLEDTYLQIYQDAVGYVKRKTQFKIDFPEQCPYTLEQLLDQNYLA
jgi:hypothetical protein